MRSYPCTKPLYLPPLLVRSTCSNHHEVLLTNIRMHSLRGQKCCFSTTNARFSRFQVSQLALDKSLVAPGFIPCISYTPYFFRITEQRIGQLNSGADPNGIFSSFSFTA